MVQVQVVQAQVAQLLAATQVPRPAGRPLAAHHRADRVQVVQVRVVRPQVAQVQVVHPLLPHRVAGMPLRLVEAQLLAVQAQVDQAQGARHPVVRTQVALLRAVQARAAHPPAVHHRVAQAQVAQARVVHLQVATAAQAPRAVRDLLARPKAVAEKLMHLNPRRQPLSTAENMRLQQMANEPRA